MDYDRDKVDEAVLALLYLTLHQPGIDRAWKGFNWDTLDRLHEKGLIDDPKNTSGLDQACMVLLHAAHGVRAKQ